MPSTSKAQQRLMGIAYALKKGEMDPKDASQEVKDLADSMTLKQLKDFAETKHKGLPDHADENITTANIGGMGATLLPTATQPGSGDVLSGPKREKDESVDDEEDLKKKRREREILKPLKTFEAFLKDRS